jgi:cytochrome P450
MIPVFTTSCSRMINQWQKMVSSQQRCEVDIWPELQKLTADVISRAAFGSNYEEGKEIFELQKELILLVLEAMQTLYIPGFR